MWDAVTPEASRRMLAAAVDAFAERGYHGTSTRQIAAAAGMSPAALYVHYRTKADLLYRIAERVHVSVLETLSAAMQDVDGHPERIRALMYAFARWHARHHHAARVIQNELGALEAGHARKIAALRREVRTLLRDAVRAGAAAGEFDVADVDGTSRALASLAIDVCRWYRPDGPRTPDEIGALYAHLALRMLRAD
ncbi:HTH-type transcriptional repressor KstR2 [Actinomadura rubteroloni]|uniref:HTH-type transcriptional repressor KstR2 n=1 Tax=Actinomadura rubteroloni TaxID=1926885 RepID=A0A2P4UDR9_9ACTN|nr:TetR family transcriptional regulator [Actinomadura rubteroloni]POM23197.1 HTH-type transcriptional repressor KstR2 [Actinomadura rubteroloni]